MKLPWITEWDLMVGLDKHNELCIPPTPPLPPLPSPMHSHIVGGTMRWALNSGEWPQHTVFVEGREPCKHFHDISYMIPHIPVPLPGWVLLPAIIPLSGSKIAIGAFTVFSNNNPVGAWGPTLNCWSSFPRPSGVIIPTRLPRTFVGVTFLDLLKSLLFVGLDMLLSYLLNRAFDKYLKGPLEKFLSGVLGKVLGKVIGAEVVAAINQAISKIVTEVGKKLFGKAGKAITSFLKETVGGWFGRTNPGMQEKYIRVFEAEAPTAFAAYLYRAWTPEIHAASLGVLHREYPGLDTSALAADPTCGGSYPEFEQAIVTSIGPMIKDGTRGLLSGEEWRRLLDSDPAGEAGGAAAPPA